ncbi:MAG: hypothetical protein M5U34_38570, partial [Chloroflexi bacterium]|nr:hypothetical protein [Chloroflexota bacterium]
MTPDYDVLHRLCSQMKRKRGRSLMRGRVGETAVHQSRHHQRHEAHAAWLHGTYPGIQGSFGCVILSSEGGLVRCWSLVSQLPRLTLSNT